MEEFKKLVLSLVKLFMAFAAFIVILLIGLYTYQTGTLTSYENIAVEAQLEWQPKDVLLELASMPKEVKEGYLLIAETPQYLGTKVADTSMHYIGNNLACANCHLQAGTQAGSASWVGVAERFPQFGGRSNKMGTLEDRINGCMERSMNGKKLPKDSQQMKAIVSYMNWLGEGLPEEKKKEFAGYVPIDLPEAAVDLNHGKAVYTKQCTVCHGENGQGVRLADNKAGYQYPPLWGEDSYNDGAGMHRVITSAEFIKSNMPFGQATWDNPVLTDQEAFDVAGYINSFSRPHKANTEKDYPDKKLKPVSTPYGPYADDFSADQHKYGPFKPIIAFYKETYNINKTK
ncbi:thiosulfate dehydrogenase [Gillisia mitskevichiae]|uniref:Thiosulfate dehydrogenase n=1 Tax=Gillisia mitskevichiae TaxID=270921 RepID=A0A495PW72_9FLAO|nr:c-type cytochrome [Gillisia mitskevichiae]RKS53738.1 thiosulfate dehydrogenase [Gillisia mitskevichiae]